MTDSNNSSSRPAGDASADPSSPPPASVPAASIPAASTAAAPPSPTSVPKPSRWRKWRRRSLWAAGIVIVLVVLLRLFLHLLLPPIISQVARQFGFEISYRRLDLVMLGGDFAVWDVVLKPLDGREELIRTDYAFVNLDTFETLRRLRLHVLRLEADSVKLNVVRKSDGSIPLLDQFVQGAAVSLEDKDSPGRPSTSPADALPKVIPPVAGDPPRDQSEPLDFTIPIVVEAVRLSRVTLDLLDESVSPKFAQTVNVDLAVSRLGAEGTPALLDLSVWTSSLLDRFKVNGSFEVHGSTAIGSLSLDIRGLKPHEAAAYLSLAGLRADGRAMDIRGSAEIKLQANTTRPGTVSGTASLADLAIDAGGSSIASLKTVAIDIGELSPSSLWLKRVDVRDGGLVTRREQDGSLGFAAILTGGPTPAAPGAESNTKAVGPAATSDHTKPARSLSPTTPPNAPAFLVRVDEFTAGSLVAAFDDAAVIPATTLSAELAELRVRNVLSSGPETTETTVLARLRLPGIAGEARIEGMARPFAPEPSGKLGILVDAIRPERLEPYLRSAGLRSTLDAARFQCDVVASVNASSGQPLVSAALQDIRLTDGGTTLLEMPQVAVVGLGFADGIVLDSATLRGPSLTVRTLPGGRLQLPGIVVDPSLAAQPMPPPMPATETPPTPVGKSAAPQLPRLRIGRLTWEAGTLRFEDGVTQGGEPLVLSDAKFELHDLGFNPGGGAAVTSKPGRISGRLKLEGVIDALTLDGTMTPGDRSLTIAVAVRGEQLRPSRLSSYLAPLGIEPLWDAGDLELAADATIQQLDDGIQLGGNIRQLRLGTDSDTFLQATHLGVDRFSLRDGGIEIGNVTVDRPLLRAGRDEQGRMIVAGVRLAPGKPSPAAAATPVSPAGPSAATPPMPAATVPNASPGAVSDVFTAIQGIGPISLQSLNASGVTIAWSDRSVASPVDLRFSLDAAITAASINRRDAAATKFRVQVAAERLLRTMTIDGQFRLADTSFDASASVLGTDLNLEAIAAYLPDGVAAALERGELKVAVTSQLARHPEGGYRADLAVRDLGLRTGERTLAAFERFELSVDRLDPVAEIVAVNRVVLAGLQADLARAEDGSIEAMGLRLGTTPASPGGPAGNDVAKPPAVPAAPAVPPAEAATTVDVQTLVARGQATLPLFSLEQLDLGVRRVSFADRMRPQAEAVALAEVRVRNTTPIRLLGKTPKDNPPLAIAIEGSIEPVIKRFDLHTSASLFSDRPTLNLRLSASGIDGSAINRIAPELNGVVDGSPLVDGRFQTGLDVEARVKRSSPTAIDLSRGFDLDFAIEGTALRLGESGVVLAGVKSVSGRSIQVDPRGGNIHARSIELDGLEANVWLDEKGLNILGLAIAMPADEPPTQPADSESASSTETASATGAASPASADGPTASPPRDSSPIAAAANAATGSNAGSEVRIDSLTISGLQFRLEDRTANPPTVIPVTALDADIRGLSSLATVADRPIRFDVSMASGKVALPKPLRGGILAGAMSDLQARSRGEDPGGRELEDRDFFAQVAARGEMSLYPKPRGRVVASVNGLELAALRGLAARAGVAISEGTFDGRFDLKSRESGDLDAKVRLVLTDLQMADSPDAAVQRYLALPAPLDSVIDLVQSADGSITLPIGFTVRDGVVNVGEIIASGVGALSQVLVTAVASAPVKVVTGVASIFGDVNGETKTVEEEPLLLPLDAGVVSLPDQAQGKLVAILAEASKNPNMVVEIQHQLGTGDVEMARVRGNPSPAQVRALAEQLRRDRQRLLADRDRALQQARVEMGAVSTAADPKALVRLQAIQSELSAIERSFDQLYDLLRPGADRDVARRTRAAAVSLADSRLQEVRAMVESVTGPAAAERVRVGVARFNPTDAADSRLVVKVVRRVQVR